MKKTDERSRLTKADLKWIVVIVLPTFAILVGRDLFPEYRPLIDKTLATVTIVIVVAIVGAACWWGYALLRARPEQRIVLLNGKDYLIESNDEAVIRSHRSTEKTDEIQWSQLQSIFLVAIDRFPIGGISFMLHSKEVVLEVPIESEGARDLLSRMQERLTGFDNRAVIEGMGMTHGVWQLWERVHKDA